MAGPDLATLVDIGELSRATKMFITGMHFLWVYDYLLTVGDEIQYAWSGRKTWVFAVFVANRYVPVFLLIWHLTVTFPFTTPRTPTVNPHPALLLKSCRATKWIGVFHSAAVTVLAEITILLRVYAVTEKNKLLSGALCVLIAAQLSAGAYSTIRFALAQPLQTLDINLDVFKVCSYNRWRPAEFIYSNIAISFDILAFSIILITAIRSRRVHGYPAIPSLLDAILRDATIYFIVIFASQLLFQLFLFLAPTNIQLLPGVASAILVPVMASRLMLSLKKTAVKPMESWSLATMTNVTGGRSPEDEEDIELDFAPRFDQNCGPRVR